MTNTSRKFYMVSDGECWDGPFPADEISEQVEFTLGYSETCTFREATIEEVANYIKWLATGWAEVINSGKAVNENNLRFTLNRIAEASEYIKEVA